MDARRRQYVPLSVRFADGHTGTRIQEQFGVAGLGVWACLLAAAKKERVQGTFSYNSEAEAWSKLGLYASPPDFTFESFVVFLGRLKQARREKRGRVVDVVLTHWGDWNQTIKRETEAEKKRRKRARNTGDNRTPIGGTEVESEGETPPPPDGSPRQNGKSPRQRGTNPRASKTANGLVPCTAGCQRWTGTTDDLAEHLATVHALDRPAAATVPDDDDLFA